MLVLIVIAIVLWIYFIWSRRALYWLSWKMPGPSAPIPIVGNIMGMWNEEGKHVPTRFPVPYTTSFVSHTDSYAQTAIANNTAATAIKPRFLVVAL